MYENMNDARYLRATCEAVRFNKRAMAVAVPLNEIFYAVIEDDDVASVLSFPMNSALNVPVFSHEEFQSLGRFTLKTYRGQNWHRGSETLRYDPDGGVWKETRAPNGASAFMAIREMIIEEFRQVISQARWNRIDGMRYRRDYAVKRLERIGDFFQRRFAIDTSGSLHIRMGKPVYEIFKRDNGFDLLCHDLEFDLLPDDDTDVTALPWHRTGMMYGLREMAGVLACLEQINAIHGPCTISNPHDAISPNGQATVTKGDKGPDIFEVFVLGFCLDLMNFGDLPRDSARRLQKIMDLRKSPGEMFAAIRHLTAEDRSAVEVARVKLETNKKWALKVSPLEMIEIRTAALAGAEVTALA